MNQNQRDADMSLAETWAPLDGCVLCVLQPRGQLFMDRTRLCCLLPAGARPTTMKWALATRGSPPLGTWGPKTLGWGGDQHSEQRRHRKRSGSLQPIVIQRAQAWESDAPGGVPALPLAGK